VKLAGALLILGLLSQAAGFVCDKSDVFGFVVPILSPTYSQAAASFDRLKATGSLNATENPFHALEGPIVTTLEERNAGKSVDGLRVVRLQVAGSTITSGFGGVESATSLRVLLSNGQDLAWTLESLAGRLEALRIGRLNCAAIAIFCFGIALQIVGFICEGRAQNSS
jgi:hypothetical protein